MDLPQLLLRLYFLEIDFTVLLPYNTDICKKDI